MSQKQGTKKSDNFQKTNKQMRLNSKESKKRKYLRNLNVKAVTDSRKFWSIVIPFFSDISNTVNNIILSDNGKMLKDEKKVAKTLNDYSPT